MASTSAEPGIASEPLEGSSAVLRLFVGSDRRAAVALSLIFLASRLAAHAAGLRFDAVPLLKYWQYVDVPLLQTNLLESLFYLHSQPPLFNLYLGLVLDLAEGWELFAFAATYRVLGLLLCLGLFRLMRAVGLSRGLALVLTALFMCSPASLLYENYLFYTYPVATFLVFAALAFLRFLSSGRIGYAWGGAALVAAVCLTRSAFHVAWLAPMALAPVLWHRIGRPTSGSRGVARLATPLAVALTVVVLLYAKNFALFGVFGASSWVGMNLASLALGPLYPEERAAMVEAGTLSGVALIPPFSPLEAYGELIGPIAPTGVAVLDRARKENGQPNFNHVAYVELSKRYERDARASLVADPILVAKSILVALRIYARPANEYQFLDRNRQAIRDWDAAFAVLHYGSPGFRDDYPERIAGYDLGWYVASLSRASPTVVLVCLLAIGYAVGTLIGVVRSRSLSPRDGALLFMGWSLLWVTLVGTTLEVGENNRFRFLTEPFALTLAALAVRDGVALMRERRGWRQPANP